MFWVTKNGIKMTGMPAFGLTHSDEKIWNIVAFVQTLPTLSANQYQQMVKQAEVESRLHDEEHEVEESHR